MTESALPDASAPPTSERSPWLWARVLLGLCLVLVVLNMFGRIERDFLDEDEISHAHAAWLVFKGYTPIVDFFEHHPPFYWQLVSVYYELFGESLGVFAFWRGVMTLCFAVSVFLTYVLGREIYGEPGGLAAAGLFCVHGPIRLAALQARPDGLMIVALLLGVWIFVRGWKREFKPWEGLVSGVLLGGAFAFHPRAGATILGLALGIAYGWFSRDGLKVLWERRRGLGAYFGAFLFMVALPFLLRGPLAFYREVYRFNLNYTHTGFDGTPMLAASVSSYALLPCLVFSALLCGLAVARRSRVDGWLDFTLLALVAVNLYSVVFSPINAFPHVFYVLIPSLALLAGRCVSWISEQLEPRHARGLLLALLVGGLISYCRPSYWRSSSNYPVQIEVLRVTQRAMPADERYFGPITHHPVFRLDASYHWVSPDGALATLRKLDPTYTHDFVGELAERQPLVVHRVLFELVEGHDPTQVEPLRRFFAERYEQVDAAWYRRKGPVRAP